MNSPACAVDELRNLLERYARAADDRDVDALAALFTAQATVVGTRGEQTIAEWLDTMRGPRTFPVSMHVFGNPLVELAADGAHATLDTYAVVYQLGDAAKHVYALIGKCQRLHDEEVESSNDLATYR